MPKVGHEIMRKHFANNCLLNASILNCPVGLYGGIAQTSFLKKEKKKTSEKYEISNQDRASFASRGGPFMPVLNDDEAFWELVGKRFVRHIELLFKHLCKGT